MKIWSVTTKTEATIKRDYEDLMKEAASYKLFLPDLNQTMALLPGCDWLALRGAYLLD